MNIEKYEEEINGLKQLLDLSDYKALKFAEGQITTEKYQPDKEARAKYRARINELEALIEQEISQEQEIQDLIEQYKSNHISSEELAEKVKAGELTLEQYEEITSAQ